MKPSAGAPREMNVDESTSPLRRERIGEGSGWREIVIQRFGHRASGERVAGPGL